MMNAATISLIDFNNNVKTVSYVWIAGVGCPAGRDFTYDAEWNPEDWAAVVEKFGNLQGSVVNGRWEWNGSGDVRDENCNTIYNVKAH